MDNTNINDEQSINTNVNDKEIDTTTTTTKDVTVNYKYGSKLHDASSEGDIATISALIEEAGFNVDLLDKRGDTPIIIAAWTNQLESLNFLLANGANVNHQSQNKDRYSNRYSCLIIAAMYNRKDMVRLLLQNGADTNLTCRDSRTALSYAADNGCVTILKALLDHKADMNIKCKLKWSPLSYSCHSGRANCASILLKHGCEIEDPNEIKNIVQFYVPLQFEEPYLCLLYTSDAADE